ncbi:MAG: ricin-type beta-trefoil lectin domain protein, partial [Nocardiopsaceae bacterium]|nr:ricin-type beta-trefoil lectin domain protein [Nocardiopsaceae bacterium]
RPRAPGRAPVAGERWGTGSCTGTTRVPAPAGFRARYAGGGRVGLTWSDPGGMYQYEIRSEDVADPAGGWHELRYPVWDAPCPGPAKTGDCFTDTAGASFLAPGHTYRFEISASNWAGASDGGFGRAHATVTMPATITAVTSGLCATATGARLSLGGCSARSAGQEWRYAPVARDGKVTEYAIASFPGGKCLVPSGRAVTLGSCSSAARGWEFKITDSGYDFDLYNKATGLCLAVNGNSKFAGAPLTLAACRTSPSTAWHSSFAR